MTLRELVATVLWLGLAGCSVEEGEPVESTPPLSRAVDDEAAETSETAAPEAHFAMTFDMMAGVADSQWEALPFDSLRLNRSGCYGTCPVYSVEFSRGGEARYVGRSYAAREGEFVGRIGLYHYGLLCSLAERTNLLGLDDSYHAGWSDDATVTIELRGKAGNKLISDYGDQAPAEFHGYRALFDEITEWVEWRAVEEER